MSERMIVVSGDGHFGGPIENYRPYIDPAYRELLDDLAEEDAANVLVMKVQRKNMSVPGVYEVADDVVDLGGDVARRLAVQDAEGIAAEILLIGTDHTQPFFTVTNKPYPAEIRTAGVHAYHRWLADVISEGKGRLLPVGYPGEISDMETALNELQWVADHGFVSVFMPGYVADPSRPPIYDESYDRFWAACADLGLVLNLHVGWGVPQGPLYELFAVAMKGKSISEDGFDLESFGESIMSKMDANTEGSPFALDLGPRQALWQLMLAGVFDRYPSLKLVLTEVRADWVPATLAHLDKRFAEERPNLKMTPSEYFARNCAVTPSSPHRVEVALRQQIGIDQFMFGADIPHPESTFPHTRQWIRHAFAGVPEPEARKILGENAVRIYNLDRDHLAGIASQIGPTTDEVFAGIDLDQRYLDNFHNRAGYLKPVEQIKINKVNELLDADFAHVAGGQAGA